MPIFLVYFSSLFLLFSISFVLELVFCLFSGLFLANFWVHFSGLFFWSVFMVLSFVRIVNSGKKVDKSFVDLKLVLVMIFHPGAIFLAYFWPIKLAYFWPIFLAYFWPIFLGRFLVLPFIHREIVGKTSTSYF